jgi:hypothetical protein
MTRFIAIAFVACCFTSEVTRAAETVATCRTLLAQNQDVRDTDAIWIREIAETLKNAKPVFISEEVDRRFVVVAQDSKGRFEVRIYKKNDASVRLLVRKPFFLRGVGGVDYQDGSDRIGQAYSQNRILAAKYYMGSVYIVSNSSIWRVFVGKQGLFGKMASRLFPGRDTRLMTVLQVQVSLETFAPYKVETAKVEGDSFKLSVSGPLRIEGVTFYFDRGWFGKASEDALNQASAFQFHPDMMRSEVSAGEIAERTVANASGITLTPSTPSIEVDDQPQILDRNR